jgi:hypothetical protein
MSRSHNALILIAVMLWQALSWVTPFQVGAQADRLAHLVAHEVVVDHHHHQDESIHLEVAEHGATHLHADGGIQVVGMVLSMASLMPLNLPASPPETDMLYPPSACLGGLLRPPQASA